QDNPAASALAVVEDLHRTVADATFAGIALQVRMGVATGTVCAGTVGGNDRLTYTVYGATVNLAQRLQAANRELGTVALACEQTISAARAAKGGTSAASAWQSRAPVRVAGFTEPIGIYELAKAGSHVGADVMTDPEPGADVRGRTAAAIA
ncbi:MAG: adenylate/guanylate cyclase domain-containing protein, partial [Pseudomonadota bacterium]